MKASNVKHLIGKRVEYWMVGAVDRKSGMVIVRHGTVNRISGRNIEIDGNWKWMPDFAHIKEAPKPT